MNGKQLKNSILQWAIEGRLVPQEPNDEPAIELLRRINPKIKPITEDTPFDIPESWEWCKLDNIGNIVTGTTPSKNNKEYYNGNIPFFKPTDLEQGTNVCEASDYLSELGYEQSRKLPSKSILVTCIGTIGKTGLLSVEGTCNQQINAIIPYDNILPLYVYYVCISDYMQTTIKTNASATTLSILNKGKFAKLIIPIPPLAEQRRIVERIEELMPLVERYAKAQEGLDKLNGDIRGKLRRSILQEAIEGRLVPQEPNDEPAIELLHRISPKFTPPQYDDTLPQGWSACKIGDLVNIISGVSYNKGDICSNGIRILRGGNIQDGKILRCPDDVFLNSKYYNSINSVYNGDIVMVASTGSFIALGKTGYCHKDMESTQIGAFLRIIRAKDIKFSSFLNLFFLSNTFKKHIKNLAKGTNINNIRNNYITDCILPLPPLAEQRRIVERIEELFAVLERIG